MNEHANGPSLDFTVSILRNKPACWPISSDMASICPNDTVRWFSTASWLSVRGFCAEDASEALGHYGARRQFFDIVRKQLANPQSVLAQIVQASRAGPRHRIFLHSSSKHVDGSRGHYSRDVDVFPHLYGGIHLAVPDRVVGGPDAARIDAIVQAGTLAHELVHAAIRSAWPVPPMGDIAVRAQQNGLNAHEDPDALAGAFEESVAGMVGHVAKAEMLAPLGFLTWHQGGVNVTSVRLRVLPHYERSRIAWTQMKASPARQHASDCLNAFALKQPRAWKAVVKIVLRHRRPMTLEEFVPSFAKAYPRLGAQLPATCHKTPSP